MAEDHRSVEEIERDLSDTRRHLETTLDALQDRMSPGSLFEDALDYVRRDGGAFGRNFIETVRDNPMPATLLTVGLGWMMMSGRNGHAHQRYGALVPAGERHTHDVHAQSGPSMGDRAGQAAHAASDTTHAAKDRLREMGQSLRGQQEAASHSTSEATRGMADSARHGMDSARASAGAAMDYTRDAVGGMGERMRRVGSSSRDAGRSVTGFFEENPLAMGIMAVAAGAALAAFLPRSRTEDETLGPLRERAMEQGRAQASHLADEATERARAAVNAAAHPEEQRTGDSKQPESDKDREQQRSSGETSAGKAATGASRPATSSPQQKGASSSPSSSPPSQASSSSQRAGTTGVSPAQPSGSPPATGASGKTPPPAR